MTSVANPNSIPQTTLYDPTLHEVVAWEADPTTTTTDNSVTPPVTYAQPKAGSVTVSPPSDLTNSGTISAAQSGINTPVASATVVLALGTGQSTWKAMLSNGGGGFTSSTTLVADKTPDGGTTWFSSSFKVNGASPNTPVSSIVGPGPLELTGNAAGATHVRIRCSVLNPTETIAARIDASTGVSEVGIIAPLPAGTNNIGSINVANTNTNGQSTMVNSAPVVIASDQSNVPVKGGFSEQAGLSTTGTAPTNLLAPLDVSAYKWWSLHVVSIATGGTLTFKAGNDGTNFINLNAWRLDNPSSGLLNSTTSAGNTMWGGPVTFRYLEVVETAWTSGTTTAVLELYTVPPPWAVSIVNAQQSGTWTVQPGNTANTTPWLFTQANNNASVPSGAANTVIKASAGAITSIVVTTAGTGAGNVVIYDNASTNSGTPLAVIPATVSVGQQYQVNGWAKVGMTAANVLNGPVFTVYYA